MYSPSFEFLKSPIENVASLLGGVPQDHEKALKHGFYNALSLFLLLLALAAGWAVYIVLEPFFKPLVWALLCGSVLYPIKYSLANSLLGWLDGLSSNSTPLLLGIMIIPLQVIDESSQRIGDVAAKYLKYILGALVCALICHIIYVYTPHICICLIWQLGIYGNMLISWFMSLTSSYMIMTVVIGYAIILTCCWTPNSAKRFMSAAITIWFLISMYLASLASSFQVTIFFIIQILFFMGFMYEVWLKYKQMKISDVHTTFCDALCTVLYVQPENINRNEGSETNDTEISGENNKKTEQTSNIHGILKPSNREESVEDDGIDTGISVSPETDSTLYKNKEVSGTVDPVSQTPKQDLSNLKDTAFLRQEAQRDLRKRTLQLHERSSSSTGGYFPHRTTSLPDTSFQKQVIAALHKHKNRHTVFRTARSSAEGRQESTKYLYGLIWACVILSMWIYTWLLYATYILLLIYVIKHTGHYFHIWETIGDQFHFIQEFVSNWYTCRKSALFPLPLTGLYKLLLYLNDMTVEIMKSSANMACCTVVILGVNIAIISTIVFLTVQVYSEGIHLLQLGSNILNHTYIRNTKMMEVFLASGWQNQIDSFLNDAYSYGRQGISTGLQHWMKGVDPEKAAKLEQQALELWDRVYQAWMTSGTATVGPKVTSSAVYASWDNIVEGVQKTPELFNMAGIMAFLQENVGTVLTVFDSVWVLFKGNITLAMDSLTALIMILFGSGSAVINFFVNLIVFFTALFYLLASSQDMYKPVDLITKFSPNSGNSFAVALEDAIASVFHASLKRAIISGLWTWLIHNLFQVRLVYIPSVLAALLGAIPFMGAYWASLPAVLELYFQDYALYAVLLALIQIISVQTVDSTLYKEIKGGGHPYLTGLSIAGGMFWLGPEGVIMGPLLLCALFVAINMSTSILQGSEADQELQEQVKHLSEFSQLRQIRRTVL